MVGKTLFAKHGKKRKKNQQNLLITKKSKETVENNDHQISDTTWYVEEQFKKYH